jgi:3-oxoacyl-[acyl-carrier protein] reductase
MRDLRGKTAIVTGAGSGIGAGIAAVLASDGAEVLLVDLDEGRLAETAARLTDEGHRARQLVADVSASGAGEQIVAKALESTGRLDIVASNVGIYPVAPLEELTDELWDRVMTVNARSALGLIRAAAPTMRSQGFGRIVVTSSITGPVTAMPGLAHYAASKAALMGLVRSAAVELAGDGITVNAVLPGTVDTEGLRASGGDGYVELMRPSIPVGRLATPSDLGWAVRLLASEEASYITGVGLIVDGGQTLPEGGVSPAVLTAAINAAATN